MIIFLSVLTVVLFIIGLWPIALVILIALLAYTTKHELKKTIKEAVHEGMHHE